MIGDFRIALKIEPVVRWQVLHPPVPGSDVIEDLVHDQPEAALAHGLRKLSVLFIAAEARVDGIEVRDGVAVIRPDGHRALEHGVQPHGRETHVGDIVQVVGNPLQVPPWRP